MCFYFNYVVVLVVILQNNCFICTLQHSSVATSMAHSFPLRGYSKITWVELDVKPCSLAALTSSFCTLRLCLILVIVWSGRHCSGTESVTTLICFSRNRTEPDTGYLHLLACPMLTYRGNLTFELTMMSINCLKYIILYAKYLTKMLRMVRLQNKKMFRDQTEATSFRPGTVPVPVPVLSLLNSSAVITLAVADITNLCGSQWIECVIQAWSMLPTAKIGLSLPPTLARLRTRRRWAPRVRMTCGA